MRFCLICLNFVFYFVANQILACQAGKLQIKNSNFGDEN
jgi:hypothetical protein